MGTFNRHSANAPRWNLNFVTVKVVNAEVPKKKIKMKQHKLHYDFLPVSYSNIKYTYIFWVETTVGCGNTASDTAVSTFSRTSSISVPFKFVSRMTETSSSICFSSSKKFRKWNHSTLRHMLLQMFPLGNLKNQ